VVAGLEEPQLLEQPVVAELLTVIRRQHHQRLVGLTCCVDHVEELARQWAQDAPVFGEYLAWGTLPCSGWPLTPEAPAGQPRGFRAGAAGAPQALVPEQYGRLMDDLRQLAELMGKTIDVCEGESLTCARS